MAVECFFCHELILDNRVSFPCNYHYAHVYCIEKFALNKTRLYYLHCNNRCSGMQKSFLSKLPENSNIMSTFMTDVTNSTSINDTNPIFPRLFQIINNGT